MEIKKTGPDHYLIQLDYSEKKSLAHCAELANESTDNLLVHILTAAISLIVLLSQTKEAYDKVSK